MKVRLLLDENLPPRLAMALRRSCPDLDVLRVGSPDAPARGTLDPELLVYLERTGRILVTDNRRTIPGHVADLYAAGGCHSGIFYVRPATALQLLVEALVLVWEASEAEEWVSQQVWIPF